MIIVDFTNKNLVKEINNLETDLFIYAFYTGKLKIDVYPVTSNKCNIYGLLFPNKDEIDLDIVIHHNQEKSYSNTVIKSVLNNNSAFNFGGLIKIYDNAKYSNAYLKNDNLVLDDVSKVKTSPDLEICTNDVKASHSATISPLNKDDILYIQSRGLLYKESVDMLVHGFVNDILSKVKNRDIIKEIIKKL